MVARQIYRPSPCKLHGVLGHEMSLPVPETTLRMRRTPSQTSVTTTGMLRPIPPVPR